MFQRGKLSFDNLVKCLLKQPLVKVDLGNMELLLVVPCNSACRFLVKYRIEKVPFNKVIG